MVWNAILGAAVGAGLSGIIGSAEASKNRRFQEAQQQRMMALSKRERQEADKRAREQERRAAALIEPELQRARAVRSSRDPFMEAGIAQASQQQAGAIQSRLEATGRAPRASALRRAQSAQAQGLMARESARLKREIEMTQTVSAMTQQRIGAGQASLLSRQQAADAYSKRALGIMGQQSRDANVWRSSLMAGIAELTEEGAFEDLFKTEPPPTPEPPTLPTSPVNSGRPDPVDWTNFLGGHSHYA